jgi:hypothetical protein
MSRRPAEEQGFAARVRDFMRQHRGWMFAVPATAFAALVILAAINLDKGSARSTKKSRIDGAAELLPPQIATAEELARASGASADQTAVSLAAGAWIQVADETGRLAQEYNATKLDPLPGSQLSMREPRAKIYLKDGRVLTLASRKGVAYVPRRALESGTLEDDVEVRLFRPKADGGAIDTDRDLPAVVVTADQAQFDGILGEVRCDRAVRIVTDAGSFAGEGLSLVLDADGDGLERLIVDRALEPIRIDRASRAMTASRRAEPAAGGIVDVVAGGAPAAAPAATPAPASSPVSAPSDPKPAKPPFYRLVMLGGVEIVRIKDGVKSTVTGDELIAVFSLESRGLDDLAFVPADAFVPDDRATRRLRAGAEGAVETMPDTMPFLSSLRIPTALAIVPLAFAQTADAADAAGDSVTVTFGGRMVMLPATDPADQLATQDDIRFDVVGSRVEAIDGRSSSRIVCSRLRYSVRDERVEAYGREGLPLTVSNPRMTLEGESFWASLRDGEGRIEGVGRMAFARGVARAVSMLEYAPGIVPDAARMLVSADPAAAALLAEPPVGGANDRFRFDPSAQELEITWKGGVDLRFAGDGDDAKLSLARFGGGVNVFARQFEMDADSLEVAFSPSDAERIDAIIADGGARDGGVSVRRLGGDGAMSARRLELFLDEDAKGDAIPRRLVARQAVEARDDRQTIWTEDLVVTFREKAAGAEGAAPPSGEGASTARSGLLAGTDGDLGDVDVDVVEAKGGVQVLLKEGARVFADTLVGEAAKRRLRLTGENVAIVRSNVVADNLRDLRFDDSTRSARSEGPGRFRAFRDPVALGSGKIERPSPDAAPTLEANWSDELDYTELSETRGTLDIRGDVKVRSKPNAQTSDAVDAQSLLLELGVDPKAREQAGTKGSAAADIGSAERTLDQFIARGGARIESRTWESPERQGDPRVFRVTGEHIEYDMRTREGLVVGDGGILVNMPPTDDSKAAEKSRAPGAITFGQDGTTRFRWKRRMALERQYDDVFKITMDNGVEVLHAGTRADDTLSMRCDVLEATVKRPLEPDAGGGAAGAATKDDRGVDLGGPAELLGIKGTGGVFIRTPDQDVECGSFDYSVTTGVATLTAEEGRTVTIAVKGQPAPIRAQQVIWDLRNGRIQVLKASGTAGR